MKQRKFKNQPGYFLHSSRWRKIPTLRHAAPSRAEPEPASLVSSEVVSQGKVRDDFAQSNETAKIFENDKSERYTELEMLSLNIEQQLRDENLGDAQQDMGWRDFLEVFDLYADDDEMFSELDAQLADFIEDFGLFGEVPNTAINNWRINRVSRTGDNKELVEKIQHAVDDYLEGIPVSYDIDGDITPQWSSEWGDYPGNIPLISFSQTISDTEHLDKIITVVDALGGRRIYIASESDTEPDNDEFNTNVLARIIPADEQDSSTVAHYLVSKEEDGEENVYIYTKDATFPAFTYPRGDTNEVYSSVDWNRDRDMMSEIASRDSAHRLWKSAAFYTVEDALRIIAQSGKCREASVEELKGVVKLAQQHVLGYSSANSPFVDDGEEQKSGSKSNREIFFDQHAKKIDDQYADLTSVQFDTINTIRGHDEASEREYQKVETYASVILSAMRYNQVNIIDTAVMNNDDKFNAIVNETRQFAQDSARSLAREGRYFLNDFRNGPGRAMLNATNSVTSALRGTRAIKEELQEVKEERSGDGAGDDSG